MASDAKAMPPTEVKTAYPYGFAFQHAVSVAIGGCRDKTRLPRSQELVLRTLLTYINAKTGICAVGYRQLVEELRMSQDDVRGHLNALIANGVVVVVKAAAPRQARELRIDLSALHKLAGGSTRPVYGKYQAETRTDSVGAYDDETRTDAIGAWEPEAGPASRTDPVGAWSPTSRTDWSPVPRTDPVGAERDVRKVQRRENYSSQNSFLSSRSPVCPPPESGGSAARKGTGAAAVEVPSLATSESPSTTTAYSSPPVEARPAHDLPPPTPLSYIRWLMSSGSKFDHDQLVLELRRVSVGQRLSEAEADAVVTAAMSAGGDA
ncbi:MAG: hypothetical protein WD690_13965 [Vicinamibacterales bacterium]